MRQMLLILLTILGCASIALQAKPGAQPESKAQNKVLRLASPDNWCPSACDSNSLKQGTYIDIARAIWPDWEIQYRNSSYTRIIKDANRGLIDGIPAAIKGEVPDFIFPKAPGSQVKWCFWVKPGSSWRYEGFQSLYGQNKNFGIVDGYHYPSSLQSEIDRKTKKIDFTELSGREVPKRFSLMILAKRLTAFVEGSQVIDCKCRLN